MKTSSDIKESTYLVEDLNILDIHLLEMCLVIEKELNIQIPDEELKFCKSCKDLRILVENLLNTSQASIS